MAKFNKTSLFLTLTFTISFSMVGLYHLFGGQYGNNIGSTALAIVYMFVPMFCAILVEKYIHKEKIIQSLLISFKFNRWFLIAWFIPVILSSGTLGISLLIPNVSFSPEMVGMVNRFNDLLTPEQVEQMEQTFDTMPVHPIWLVLLQGLIAGPTINAVAGFGEELGWRGFLLKSYKNMKFPKASITIGFIWGIWHAPLILMGHNYPQNPEFGIIMVTIWCILLTPLFIYITLKAKSVLAAAIMHGTLNATAGIAIMVIEGGNDLTVGISGLSGFISLLIILLALIIYDIKLSKEKIMISKISSSL